MAELILQGFEGLEGLLADMADGVAKGDYEKPLRLIQDDLQEQHGEMFTNQAEADGTPWEPLSQVTVAKKGHARILYEFGDLLASLVEAAGPGAIRDIDSEGLTFGTDDHTAWFHQHGTENMPARPPVGMSEETMDKAAGHVADETVTIALEEIR